MLPGVEVEVVVNEEVQVNKSDRKHFEIPNNKVPHSQLFEKEKVLKVLARLWLWTAFHMGSFDEFSMMSDFCSIPVGRGMKNREAPHLAIFVAIFCHNSIAKGMEERALAGEKMDQEEHLDVSTICDETS